MKHVPLIILGAGTGGMAMAWRMSRRMPKNQILIIDPSSYHYFQPHWSLAGAGLVKSQSTKKSIKQLLPPGIQWFKTSALDIIPEKNQVITEQFGELTYNHLIIATGTELNWNQIEGLNEQKIKDDICSTYFFAGLDHTYKTLKKFKGGTALFTMPSLPFKCPGAPQKIMYLADQIFRENHVRENTEIIFLSDNESLFNVEESLPILQEVIRRKQIQVRLNHQLTGVDTQKKVAYFNHHVSVPLIGGKYTRKEIPTEISFDFLHVVPPQSAPAFLSRLCKNGWLSVDNITLQHTDYANIFGIGDVVGISSTKTASAIRAQAPVLESNLISLITKRPLGAKYNGESLCPMETDKRAAIIIRLRYGQKHQYSTKERYLYWLFKRYLMPWLYWWGLIKGF